MSCRKNLLQVQVTVPSYFLCPISLELMLDPVTLSSGQTFDRRSIEPWLDEGRPTCPVTRLPIDPDQEEPIPNHTLRRMIQAWCVQNSSFGVERILTPRQPPSLRDIPSLVDRLSPPSSSSSSSSPHRLLDALQLLARLALDRPPSRRHIRLAGALPSLTKLLSRSISGFAPSLSALPPSTSDEALKLFDLLIDPDQEFSADDTQLFCSEDLVISLANLIVRSGKPDSRLRAASILMRLQPSAALKRRMGEMQGFINALVEMLSEGEQALKAALALLVEVCASSNQSRVAATDAGVVSSLTGLLESNDPGSNCDRARTETTLKALEVMCQCAEGRAAVVRDASVLVAVVKQMSAVSETAAHHAVSILLLVTKWVPEVKSLVVREGALVKAVAVAQSAAISDTKLAARKLIVSLREAVSPSDLAQTMRLA